MNLKTISGFRATDEAQQFQAQIIARVEGGQTMEQAPVVARPAPGTKFSI